MARMITDIVPRIREVNKIIADCSSGTIPFEQAFVLARFYYDFQDTNVIIAEAEAMAADDLNGLRTVATKTVDREPSALLHSLPCKRKCRRSLRN